MLPEASRKRPPVFSLIHSAMALSVFFSPIGAEKVEARYCCASVASVSSLYGTPSLSQMELASCVLPVEVSP